MTAKPNASHGAKGDTGDLAHSAPRHVGVKPLDNLDFPTIFGIEEFMIQIPKDVK